MQQNRRRERSNIHEVAIALGPDGAMDTACSCGVTIARRTEDKTRITLSDMLAAVRKHSNDLDRTS